MCVNVVYCSCINLLVEMHYYLYHFTNLACLLKHQTKRNQHLRLSSLASLIQKHMSKMANTMELKHVHLWNFSN